MKKMILSLTAVAVMFSSLTFTACKGESPDDSSKGIAGTVGKGETLELKAADENILNGSLIVEEGGTLKIEAGTVIKAKAGFSTYILIAQGGKIDAKGTADKPIRFTANVNDAQAAHWGGLIINGLAPLTSSQKTAETEINKNYLYGGSNAADNSGVLEYVTLEYTGSRSSANIEHNGLTLNGVGSGTKIENVYVYECGDDGIEFFGGSVNVKNLLVVNTDDDMFDFTQGYSGTLENAYGVWDKGFTSTEADPRGIEADGNFDGNFATDTHQSNFTVRNMTIDLRLDFNTSLATQMQQAIKIRRGAKATVTNALITGTGSVGALVDLTDSKGVGDPTSSVSLTTKLTTPAGVETKGAGMVSYPTTNTGCDKAVFAWTKYAL